MDDKRVTVDLDLRTKVLDPLSAKHGVARLDLVHMFVTFAISKKLDPLPPSKKEVLSGDVFEDQKIYRLVAVLYGTDEPRRVAHELANAGMRTAVDKPLEELELTEVFEFI